MIVVTFDRVISNPPFSQNYTREGMQFTGRFMHGFDPTKILVERN